MINNSRLYRICIYNPHYLVYRDGSLFSMNSKIFVKASPNGRNSPYLFWRMGSSTKKHYCHRLVAEHFLDNPNNCRDVHHIDHDPTHNNANNLQWMTHKQNCQMKIYEDPLSMIEKNDKRFIYFDKRMEQFTFSFKRKDISKVKKFRTLEEAKDYRNWYFNEYYSCL